MKYRKEAEQRYNMDYDLSFQPPRPVITCGKRHRPSSSESDSSDGEEVNEFTIYLFSKRDKSVQDPLS